MMKQKIKQISNKDLVIDSIKKYPGLRFFELKKQTGLVNGVLQHHLQMHIKLKNIRLEYDNTTPRYYSTEVDKQTAILLKRLRPVSYTHLRAHET